MAEMRQLAEYGKMEQIPARVNVTVKDSDTAAKLKP
jgi:hypothetical protein